jgi:hypothetical protein
MNALLPVLASRAPALAAAGARAVYRFLEFFTAQRANPASAYGTQLCDRRAAEVTLGAADRFAI